MDADRTKPSQVDSDRSWFDEVGAKLIDFTSRGRFLLIVFGAFVFWLAFGAQLAFANKWLEAGAAGVAWATLVLVFAVENANKRRDQALQHKLNAIAGALAEFMNAQEVPDEHVSELRAAVGLEHRESTD